MGIDLLNSHSNRNVTPIHELFHQYQYGYAMLKARCFLEDTARRAEYALRMGVGAEQPLPADLARTTCVDGSPVIHDGLLRGTAFMKAQFEALGPLDHQVSARNGWPIFGWKEEEMEAFLALQAALH